MKTNPATASKDAAPREVAPFLKSLRRMLEDEDAAVLRWTPNGCAFEIHDMDEMMASVLPKYFKHCKYTSFQRQLNYFNFRKWTKSKAVVCTFSNDFFLRDRPELAWQITRKKSLHSSPPRYRSTLSPPRAARASAMPYWKRPRGMMLPAPHPMASPPPMLLGDPARRLPFPSPTDPSDLLMLKDGDLRQPRRFYGGLTAPLDVYGRSYEPSHGNGGDQAEPLDWIDCLLPPTDETYTSMYPPAAVAPFPMSAVNTRKCFEFVPSNI